MVVSKSCKKIFVGIEGNPFEMADGTPVNPEGYVLLIEFPSRDLRKASFRTTKIDFSEFDSRYVTIIVYFSTNKILTEIDTRITHVIVLL